MKLNLKNAFEEFSILNFTYEMNVNGKLLFLDVMVNMEDGALHANVYRKTLTLVIVLKPTVNEVKNIKTVLLYLI